MDLKLSQTSMVHELFVHTADENYIAARWCAANGLQIDFLWLSVHALEKYLKAVLLLNGQSAKGYSHDIVKLYGDVHKIAGSLLPGQLQRPQNLNIAHWRNRSPVEFLEHLLENGNADNRYLTYGFVTSPEDLHMLDQMVFAIRRLACVLDGPMSNWKGAPNITNRQVLTQSPLHYTRMALPLEQALNAVQPSEKQFAALNLNLAFAPTNFPHQPARGGYSSRNPVIFRRILEPLGSADSQTAIDGIATAKWFLDNVQVPKDVKTQIEAAVAAAKQSHSLP